MGSRQLRAYALPVAARAAARSVGPINAPTIHRIGKMKPIQNSQEWPLRNVARPRLGLRGDSVRDRVDALVLVQRLVVLVGGGGFQIEDDLLDRAGEGEWRLVLVGEVDD